MHVVERMAPGGIETLVLDLVRDGWGDDVVISLEGRADELMVRWPALRPLGTRLIGLGRRPGVQPLLAAGLASVLKGLKPYAVVAHHIGPLIYGGTAARLAGVPRLIHVEHDVWHYQSARHRKLARWCSALLRPCHVAVSKEAAATLRRVVPDQHIEVIAPGVDLERFRPRDINCARDQLNFSPVWKLVGTAGRLVPVKGQEVLIRALHQLGQPFHGAILGDGPERGRLENLSDHLGLTDRVHFLGHRDDPENVLPAFDVFCLPSLAEGLPRSVLEAQACGVPVVATRVGALEEAVCGETGLIVPASDAGLLAEAIRSVAALPSPEQATRSFISENYSFERTRRSFRDLIEA